MPATAEKTSRGSVVVQQKATATSFFRKAAEDSFFGMKDTGSFFNKPIQAKLSVSSPDDPQEKEADVVADQVMRMPEPASVPAQKEEEKLQRSEEQENEIQPKLDVPGIRHIQCKEEGEEIQAKLFNNIHRRQETYYEKHATAGDSCTSGNYPVNHKPISLYPSDVIQCSGRGPPGGYMPFEQILSSSKGSGSVLPESTKQHMESRFGADFSGVRIHTGSNAEHLSSHLHAQAFTHGNDIYFNSGKYSPHTEGGGTLLAHELTHTVQQGASPTRQSTSVTPSLARKEIAEPGKETFNVSRKEDSEQYELIAGAETVVQPKAELSTLHVNSTGKLHTSNQTDIHLSEDLQSVEEEITEEKETKNSTVLPAGKKISAYPVQSKCESCQPEKKMVQAKYGSQVQADQNDSSLNGNINEATYKTIAEHDRGPPVQAKLNGESVIQRSVIDDALAYAGSVTDCISVPPDLEESKACALRIAQNVAMHIPGYRALRVVLGADPITGEGVVRNGHNFIEAAFDIMPGGQLLYQKLNELQLLDGAATWIDERIAFVESLVNTLSSAFDNFWNSIGLTDITSPMDVLERGANLVLGFINRVIDFAVDAAPALLKMVKDFLLTQIVDFIKQQTPVYPLLTVILGKDPITDTEVERNGTNILNAILELGGEEGVQQRTQMQETGTFQKVAAFIDEGIAIFSGAYVRIAQGFRNIWDIVSIESLMDPVGTFLRIYNEFAEPVAQVLDFVVRVGTEILSFIKEVLMQRLSAWARTVRGYYALTLIIGQDPFTGEEIPFSVENVIHAFMSLMDGGEEQFNQMKETGAIGRASQQIEAAVAQLNMTPLAIIHLYIDLWTSFGLNDLADPIGAFQRVINTFGEPILRLIVFVAEIVRIVIYVILQIMNFPFDVINNIITRSMQAFGKIKADPVGFLRNILKAIKQGFIQFFDNIATHLLNGLTGWLLSELKDAKVVAPTDFSLKGIIEWVLELLGISMEKVWEKLAAHPRVGPQRVEQIKGVIDKLEGIWTFIRDVQDRGMAAIWDKIQEQLSNLWTVVLEAITKWVMEKIIIQVTLYLLGLLDPTFIMSIVNSVIIIYRAIRSFVRYAEHMLNVLNSFVNGVADIAEGNITIAANYLEDSMDKAMPVVIGFLADQAGLGGAGRKVGEMIESVREMVDKALEWLVNKAVDMGLGLLDKAVAVGKAAVGAVVDWWKKTKPVTTKDGAKHTIYLEGSGDNYHLMIKSTPETYSEFIENALEKNGITTPSAGSPEERALQKAGQIDKELEGYGKVKQEDRAAWGEKISGMIDELADLTSELNINWNVPDPPSVIRWGGPNSEGFGTIMSAELLSENYIKGEPAEDEKKAVLGWDYARSFQTISKKGEPTPLYVKGHLLNENLGGPANVINLTPITNDMNKEHLKTVERDVKKLVLGKSSAVDKTPTPKQVVNYTVDVQYAKHPARTGLVNEYLTRMLQARKDYSDERKSAAPDPAKLAAYKAEDEAAMNIMALITYEDNSLTTGFRCQWEQLQYNIATSKWEPVPGTNRSEPIEHKLPNTIEHYKPVFETFKTDLP